MSIPNYLYKESDISVINSGGNKYVLNGKTTYSSEAYKLTNTSKAYFLQETDTGRFEVYFGDDVIGSKLSDGNIVILQYVVSNREEANGASSFS